MIRFFTVLCADQVYTQMIACSSTPKADDYTDRLTSPYRPQQTLVTVTEFLLLLPNAKLTYAFEIDSNLSLSALYVLVN